MTKLFGWRLRDWVSCFFASKFDQEPENTYRSFKTPLPVKGEMAFEAEKKMPRHTRDNIIRSAGLKQVVSDQDTETLTTANYKNMIINRVGTISDSDSNRFDSDSDSNFDDNDYIIFSYREDGSFGLLKNDKPDVGSSNWQDATSRTSSSVNQKNNYEETIEEVALERRDKCNEERFSGKSHDSISLIDQGVSHQMETEEEYIFSDAELVSETMDLKEHKRALVLELNDSVESSHARSSSFTFPVLTWEWIGSPLRMPNTQGTCLKKSKKYNTCCLGFQC